MLNYKVIEEFNYETLYVDIVVAEIKSTKEGIEEKMKEKSVENKLILKEDKLILKNEFKEIEITDEDIEKYIFKTLTEELEKKLFNDRDFFTKVMKGEYEMQEEDFQKLNISISQAYDLLTEAHEKQEKYEFKRTEQKIEADVEKNRNELKLAVSN